MGRRDDEEDRRPAFGAKNKYSGPVQFVSGGVSIGNKMEDVSERSRITELLQEDEPPVPTTSALPKRDDVEEVSVFRTKPKRFGEGKKE